jgi:hypothetical protein
MPHSSRFARIDNVTLRVMGGKSGKIAARNGKDVATDGTVGGKNGNGSWGCGHVHDARVAVAIGRWWASLARYGVVRGAGDARWRRVGRTKLPWKVADVKERT